MKKVIVIGIVAACMVACAAAAYALPTTASASTWRVYLEASESTTVGQYLDTEGTCQLGTSTTVSNDESNDAVGAGYYNTHEDPDGADTEISSLAVNTASAEISAYDLPTGTNQTPARYNQEIYDPIGTTYPTGGEYVWNMNLFVGTSYTSTYGATTVTLSGWTTSKKGSAVLPTGFTTLALYETSNTGLNFVAADSTLLWNVASSSTLDAATSAAPNYDSSFSVATAGDGVTSAYHLQLVASTPAVVSPEPGSLLALLSGLVGIVGYGIRRRK